VPEVLVLGVTLRAGGPDLTLVVAVALSNLPETAGMPPASRSSTYVLSLWSGMVLGTAVMTALAFYFLSELGPDTTATLKAYGAGALIAMAAETMIPEAFHNGPATPAFSPLRASQSSSFSANSPDDGSVIGHAPRRIRPPKENSHSRFIAA
jgi:zinc transporter ZupT